MNYIEKYKMKETDIQHTLLEYLGYQKDIYFFRAGTGAIKTESGGYFKTGKKGCPDIIICLKGKFIGIEVKNEKGKQSEYQKQAEDEIKQAGGEYYIVRRLEELIVVIESHKIS